MQFIDLKAQYNHLKVRIDQRIQKVLDHGQYIMGPEVSELEEKLAEYVGVKHAIGVANGTDALQLALMALNVGPGDAVFVPTFTFFASAEVVPLVGATPVFVDICQDTYNIDPVSLEAAIANVKFKGELTPKAIVAVDLFGLPADYPALERIASDESLYLIEDAAQGFGGTINGQKAGSFGHIATTSFFPAKPIGCYGDGGAVFANDDELAALLRSYHVHGKGADKYDNVRIGLNSRLDTIQAAVLLEKLAVFDVELSHRQRVADAYNVALADRFNTPVVPKGHTSSWAQYTVQSREGSRADIMEHLKKQGVPSFIYYGRNMHEQTAFKGLGYRVGDFPVAEAAAKAVFSLPMHPYLDEETQKQVLGAFENSYGGI